ncbi:anthranilate synthase component I family protein [Flexithrix dorotheae]|uniref:anthranilate synthase component I family protein n=1 Tax=Flexithrix dorotheae TaxID=70993 RepID=UPI000372B11C|nr:anthranilate synthase component I family protein [Flexithrix dorotheae]
MKKFKITTKHKKLLADTYTPVSMYLQLRDYFVNTILLESSDYHGNENAFTYICCEPIARFEAYGKEYLVKYPDNSIEKKEVGERKEILAALNEFTEAFDTPKSEVKFIQNGLFGYMSFDAVQDFEEINFTNEPTDELKIPEVLYQVYRYVIAINHFNEEVYLFEHQVEGNEVESKLDTIQTLLSNRSYGAYNFETVGEETTNFTDAQFLEVLQKGKDHCHRGDVFQIVLSRRFSKAFKGDDFNVYRALRSINPSPYLFYFDFGNFKIFGSSPETQIAIKDKKAAIYPIAGTFRRTGNDEQDAVIAKELFDDPKENSEHVMLVDLARNDMSRNGENVKVETFKEIQYFSHVIHLVSKVTGDVTKDNILQVVADTFPAGTLSGAPKYKAMELIDKYENISRGYYGGCIGFLGFNGDFNHAIMIRSFLSKNNQLHYQAGAGVVAKSETQSELEEVNNKLMALRKALDVAKEIR